MSTLERIKNLCEKHGITVPMLEERLGIPNNTIYQWKENSKRKPSLERLEQIADYFNVSIDYLRGRTDKMNYYDLTEEDEKEVDKELERILNSAESNFGLAAFDGREIDDMDKEDYELYVSSLRNAIRMHKRLAKKKFTPKKYR